MRSAFIEELERKAKLDPRVFLLVGDLGFGVVEKFQRTFPNQFLNAGVAEQNMMGMASGLAFTGKIPFVYSIANFPTFRCLEQIRNDVAYHNLPVCIVSVGAGMSYGSLGYSHQAIEDISILRALPNLRILSPGDPEEVKTCVALMLSDPEPTYLRIGKNGEKSLVPLLQAPDSKLSPRKMHGSSNGQTLILSTGAIGFEVSVALKNLAKNVEFFSISKLKPLNLEGINIANYSRVITVEEHVVGGGFGSIILEHLSDNDIRIPLHRIGLRDTDLSTIGSMEYMRQVSGLDALSLTKKFESLNAV